MIQKNEEYLYKPFSKDSLSYQMLTSGKSVIDIIKDAKSPANTQSTPKVYATQTTVTPKSTYSVEERDARVRNAYAERTPENQRKAEPQVPKQEDDFLKGFLGDREEDTKVRLQWTKPVHTWETQNIFGKQEETQKLPNMQWGNIQKLPKYGDTPEFQNYSFSRPTGDIETDEDLEVFLEGFSDPYGEKKKEEKSKYQKNLDGISTALTAASFIPGLDTITNIAQIPVDLLRGDFLGAGLDFLGAFPLVGEIADIGKTARTADGIVDAAKVATKADDAVDAASAVRRTGIEKLSPSQFMATHELTMSKKQYAELLENIKNNGVTEAIKYVEYNGKNYIVDGHHRLRAARQLGLAEIPAEKVFLPYGGYKTPDDLLWFD